MQTSACICTNICKFTLAQFGNQNSSIHLRYLAQNTSHTHNTHDHTQASASTAADDYTAGVKEAEEDNTAFNIELNGPAPPPPTKSPDPISPDGAYTALPSKALLLAVVAGLLLLGLQLA